MKNEHPIYKDRDWLGVWEAREACAEERLEIARHMIVQIVHLDQLVLFDENNETPGSLLGQSENAVELPIAQAG